jgi:putative ABC transport system permease protein
MDLHTSLSLAWRALLRDGLRSALTLVGITIGVGAVLTMVAVGSGARASIEDQVAAAGLNVITVTAGNYKMKTDDPGGGVVDHQARFENQLTWGCAPHSGSLAYGGPSVPLRSFTVTPSASTATRPATNENEILVGRRIAVQKPDDGCSALSDVRFWTLMPSPRAAVWRPSDDGPAFHTRLIGHPEDDPMEKHDHPTSRDRLGDSAAGLGAAATLTTGDADAIRRQVPGVQYVASGVHESARVVLDRSRWFTRLHGTDADFADIRRTWSYKYGRFFSAREASRGEQVLAVGHVVSEKLFAPGSDPTKTTVTIWNQPFNVVGVISSTNWASSGAVGDDEFDAVYVPLATVHRLLNLSKLNTITITAKSAADVSRVAKAVTKLLRVRHEISETEPDDFVVATQAGKALGKGINPQVARAITGNVPGLEAVTLEQLSTTLARSSQTMTALLASVAGVSLLVGGIGIMNVMLLSVTERTREIGLRMALGARSRDVLMQFLAEAVTLSMTGGVMGVALGLAAAGGVRQMLRWATVVSPGAIVLAVGVAAMVGVCFGLYPARRASMLDPIDALRFE